MAKHVRVAIIGGGIVDCATVLHLAEAGWSDLFLLERGWSLWGHDVNAEISPYQAGLGGLVYLKKDADFPGRAALETAPAPQHRLCLLELDAKDSDCLGVAPLFHDGAFVGQVASGGYGDFIGRSLAIGWLPARLTASETQPDIELYGEGITARVLRGPPCPR